MSNDEWKLIAACIASLWPKFGEAMTPEQAKAWRDALDRCQPDRVKAALLDWYRHEAEWPILARVVGASQPTAAASRPHYPGPATQAERDAIAAETKRQARLGMEMLAARRSAKTGVAS